MGKPCCGKIYLPKNVFEMYCIRDESSSENTQSIEVLCMKGVRFLFDILWGSSARCSGPEKMELKYFWPGI